MNLRIEKNRLKRLSLLLMIMLFFSISGRTQTIIGKWKTIDEETNKAKSIVEIWKAENGLFYGKIIKLYDKSKINAVCSKCEKSDSRYNQKILGLTIITKMKKTDNNEWKKGEILDPSNGKVYKCKIFREGENLMVRGYIGFFFRTQKWLPVTNE